MSATQRELDDDFNARHQPCDLDGCTKGDVCVSAPDGQNWCGCNGAEGSKVADGYVHDTCRDHYTTLLLRDEILAGLLVRRGMEITDITAGERANNLAIILREMFDVRLK
jgi:hypothetical protein